MPLLKWSAASGARAFSALSVRQAAAVEDAALAAAKAVQHPVLKSTLGTLNWVKSAACTDSAQGTTVTVDIAPFSAASATLPQLAHACEQAVAPAVAAALQGTAAAAATATAATPAVTAASVRIRTIPSHHSNAVMRAVAPVLGGVGSAVAVHSCKGGVGKSTVAVNLAYALSACGARTGLLDADVHGPSLPTMVSPADTTVVKSASGTINTVAYGGVQCMSYGWVSKRDARGERGGAVMRGPMLSQVTQQLIKFTTWGELDHLVVDMPPGTGDIQLTIGQTLPLTSAVIVTTPQKLAVVDVLKGLTLFHALKIPVSAIVLNMAHFDADGKRYYPFGRGEAAAATLLERCGLTADRLFAFPIEPSLSEAGDSGVPEVMARPDSDVSRTYRQLARVVAADAEQRVVGAQLAAAADAAAGAAGAAEGGAGAAAASVAADGSRITVRYNESRHAIVMRTVSGDGAREVSLPPAALRRACRCAACVDEITGAQRLQPDSVPDAVRPLKLTPQGNYGVAVTWSDGHSSSLYGYEQVLQLAAVATATAASGSK